jgi:hypothetical protein
MNREATLLAGGIGLGAALMYILDPDRGRRRRALLRDQLLSAAHRAPDVVGTAARDLSNRARGLAAEAGSMFSSDEVSDDVLVARVRSKMGRVVSHPHAVEVTADQGRVTLSGPVLAREVGELLSCASRVSGVTGVENRLEVHEEAGNVSALQGGRRRADRFEFFQENWSPMARLLAGVTGGALAAYGLSRRDPLSLAVGAAGVGLLARGVTNKDASRLVGAGAALFDSDPKRVADEDPVRVESPTESANTPHEPAENQPRAFGASA